MTRGERTRIEDVETDAGISDGRVSMDVENEAAKLFVGGRDRQPLSTAETHVTLEVFGEEFHTAVRLDGEEADALRDALDLALSWESNE